MCSHQQDLGYKGFIANIIICEKVFCPVMDRIDSFANARYIKVNYSFGKTG